MMFHLQAHKYTEQAVPSLSNCRFCGKAASSNYWDVGLPKATLAIWTAEGAVSTRYARALWNRVTLAWAVSLPSHPIRGTCCLVHHRTPATSQSTSAL